MKLTHVATYNDIEELYNARRAAEIRIKQHLEDALLYGTHTLGKEENYLSILREPKQDVVPLKNLLSGIL